jgi:hypothetical protein
MDYTGRPLVDCCAVDEEERVFRRGVPPYAIDPDPLERPLSRRRLLRRASLLGAAALATACAKSDDGGSSTDADPAPTTGGSASATPSQPAASGDLQTLDLPYCSQILCGVPLETAVARGFFEAEGLKSSSST